MSHPLLKDIQSAYTNASQAYSRAFETQAFLEQAKEMIADDEAELYRLIEEALEKTKLAVIATRDASQPIEQLMTRLYKQG